MRCLTLDEARRALAHCVGSDGRPIVRGADMKGARFYFGEEPLANIYWVAFRLVECIGSWEDAWLWVDRPDTWKRQGLHLFNRLRESYGQQSLITDKPVHQFHGYEEADLCSFVAVVALNEWAMYLLTSHDYGRLHVSQSSGAEVWTRDAEVLPGLARNLQKYGIEMGFIADSDS